MMFLLSFLTNILMVGHSLVGPTLPVMIQNGMVAAGQPSTVRAQVINGAPLKYQWQNGASAEGVDARAELALGKIGRAHV